MIPRYIVRLIDLEVSFSEMMRGIKGAGYPWEIGGTWQFGTLLMARRFAENRLWERNSIWSDKYVISRRVGKRETYIGSVYRTLRWRPA